MKHAILKCISVLILVNLNDTAVLYCWHNKTKMDRYLTYMD